MYGVLEALRPLEAWHFEADLLSNDQLGYWSGVLGEGQKFSIIEILNDAKYFPLEMISPPNLNSSSLLSTFSKTE